MSNAPTPAANWPLPSLLTSLANAGWGDLSGRSHAGLRATLKGLEALLPHKTARGHGTAWQVAQRAGLSERWTRRCLSALEELGLIKWQRGTIAAGKAQPSYFVVCKGAIARLIRVARKEVSKRLAARRRAFLARLATIRNANLPRYNWQNAAPRPALSATRTPLQGGTKPAPVGARLANHPPGKDKEVVKPPKITLSLLPATCDHNESSNRNVIASCPDCRALAVKPEDYAEFEAELMKEKALLTEAEPMTVPSSLATNYPGLTGKALALAVAKRCKAKS